MFRSMRKGKVSYVVAQSGHSYDHPPVRKQIWAIDLGDHLSYLISQILGGRNHIEYLSCHVHNAE